MRIAVISDIHGNLEAFFAVLEDMGSRQVDRVVSLGDNIGYGADSESVVRLLISRKIPTVLGNHDMAAMHEKILNWHVGDVKKAIAIAAAGLSEASLRYLRGATTNLSHGGCLFVHGFPPDSFRLYLSQAGDSDLRRAFAQMKEDLCFVGHTHDLRLWRCENSDIRLRPMTQAPMPLQKHAKYIINVGSVGQPRDGGTLAKYVIWDSRTRELEIRAVPYDTATAARKIIAAGIPSRFAAMIEGK